MSNNNWPDWSDAGRLVEVDTTITQGYLAISDYMSYENGEEYPIFSVTDNNNVEHVFAMNDDWRFL